MRGRPEDEAKRTAPRADRGAGASGAKGFSLLEILIVVGVIVVLSAILVPNLLEARTRAKVSRVKSDLRWLPRGIRLPEDKIMEDPFARGGAPYSFSTFYYSIGPDSKDDGGQIIYDATNGTTSRGDITSPRG